MNRKPGSHGAQDEGSGTVAGAALVLAAALLLVAIASGAAIVVNVMEARDAADLAALAGANALWDGASDPCGRAAQAASANGAQLQQCELDAMDVVVTVRRSTGVALLPEAVRSSRAGPRECEAR